MWNWIKRLLTKSSAPPEHPYYGARVIKKNDAIHVYRNNGYNEQVRKKNLFYIGVRRYDYDKANGS